MIKHTNHRALRFALLASFLTAALTGCGGATQPPASSTDTSSDTPHTQQEQPDMVSVNVFNEAGELVGPVEVPTVRKTDEQWKAELTPEQYDVTRRAGTERPFTSPLLENKREGVYVCAACKLPLFASKSKFNSGTGWPSFYEPIAPTNVADHVDRSLGMTRTENTCPRCGAHLGHVFPDGPQPTGLRYCINGDALSFVAKEDLKKNDE